MGSGVEPLAITTRSSKRKGLIDEATCLVDRARALAAARDVYRPPASYDAGGVIARLASYDATG